MGITLPIFVVALIKSQKGGMLNLNNITQKLVHILTILLNRRYNHPKKKIKRLGYVQTAHLASSKSVAETRQQKKKKKD